MLLPELSLMMITKSTTLVAGEPHAHVMLVEVEAVTLKPNGALGSGWGGDRWKKME